MIHKVLASLFVVITTVLLLGTTTSAEDLPVEVTPILPDNQDDNIKSYISINTDEIDFKQEIQFEVENKSDDVITLEIEPLNALNSPQQEIQYISSFEEANASLVDKKYGLANYINMESQITLSGGETKVIAATIDIPELEGTILGAIGFNVLNTDTSTGEASFVVHTELNRIIGVQINGATDKEVQFSVGEPYIEPLSPYYVIRIPVQMKSPLLLNDVVLEYEVLNKDGEILFTSSNNGLETPFNIAPSTNTNFSIPWNNDTIKDKENYSINVRIKYDGKTFDFNKDFQYTDKNKYQDIKKNDSFSPPEIERNGLYGWLILIVITISLGAYLFYRKKRLKKVNSN